MGDRPSTRPPSDAVEDHDAVGGRVTRNLNRRLFREMIKTDIEDRPLNWLRRHAFVRFAARIGIDPFEAKLIIRAVEYECGHAAPAAMADVESRVQPEFIAQPGAEEATWRAQLLAAGIIMIVGGIAWYLRISW